MPKNENPATTPSLQIALDHHLKIINQTKFLLGETVPAEMTDEFVQIHRDHFGQNSHSAYACLAPDDDTIFFVFCTKNLDRLGTISEPTREKFHAARKTRRQKRETKTHFKIGKQFLKIIPATGILSDNDLYSSMRLRLAASGCCLAGTDLIPQLLAQKSIFKKTTTN